MSSTHNNPTHELCDRCYYWLIHQRANPTAYTCKTCNLHIDKYTVLRVQRSEEQLCNTLRVDNGAKGTIYYRLPEGAGGI